MKLTEAIADYFSKNSNEIVSKDNVRIRKRGDFFMIDYVLAEPKVPGGLSERPQADGRYVLHEEALGVGIFLNAYNIKRIADLQLLKGEKLWERYFEGAAEVVYTNRDKKRFVSEWWAERRRFMVCNCVTRVKLITCLEGWRILRHI